MRLRKFSNDAGQPVWLDLDQVQAIDSSIDPSVCFVVLASGAGRVIKMPVEDLVRMVDE